MRVTSLIAGTERLKTEEVTVYAALNRVQALASTSGN
jgi:hypothetical protein